MRIGLVKDESKPFDGYNWYEVYAKTFHELNVETKVLDFRKSKWASDLKEKPLDAILWRAWHYPPDRDDAKRKIYFIDRVLGMQIFPNWDMYWAYDDKIAQLQLMKYLNIPHPKTFVSRDLDEVLRFIKDIKLPIVAKAASGACCKNVKIIHTRTDLYDYVEKIFTEEGLPIANYERQREYVYFQEFLPIDRDLRIITVGDEVVYAVWFEGEEWKKFEGEARINPRNIPEAAKRLCIEATKKLKYHWAAFDVAIVDGQPLVFEFTSVFGFSFPKKNIELFGSPDAGVLDKQARYVYKIVKEKKGK